MNRTKNRHETAMIHNTSARSAIAATECRRSPASMRHEEYAALGRLLEELKPNDTLEIGMANGESSCLICSFLHDHGGGRHVAVDPFETSESGWNGQGLRLLEDSGLRDHLDFIEDYDYLAMPQLIREGRRFDFVLIDGWHSFDYTLLDLFYADLLLKVGGVVVVHDTGWPAVYKAVRFLESHKPYERISPPPTLHLRPLHRRLLRRLGQLLSGPRALAEAKSRRENWCSLAAYRKLRDEQVPEHYNKRF